MKEKYYKQSIELLKAKKCIFLNKYSLQPKKDLNATIKLWDEEIKTPEQSLLTFETLNILKSNKHLIITQQEACQKYIEENYNNWLKRCQEIHNNINNTLNEMKKKGLFMKNVIYEVAENIWEEEDPTINILRSKELFCNQKVYSYVGLPFGSWSMAEILTIDDETISVKFVNGNIKNVNRKQIAHTCKVKDNYIIGTRVIVKCQRDGLFYAGIVAECPKLFNNFRFV